MKIMPFPFRSAGLLATGAFSLLCFAASCLAGPGGGSFGGGTGSASTGGATGGGGHGGGLSGGGGHVGGGSIGAVGHAGGGFVAAAGRGSAGLTGARFTGLVPTGFPSRQGAGVTGANGSNGFSREGNGSYVSAYGGRAAVENAPGFTMSRSFDGGGRTGEMRVTRSTPSAANTPQIRNAWTEPNNPHVNPASRPSRYGYNNAYDEDRSALQNRVAAGQHINPGAAGYNALSTRGGNGSGSNQGQRGDRRTRDAYNRFYFTSLFYPYLYNSFFPFYGSYFGDGYGIGGFSGFDDNASDDPSFNTPINGNVTNTSNNPYGNEPNQNGNNPNQPAPAGDDGSLPPNQPSSVGPQNPPNTQQRESTETGPDTLVESVQNELSKRGYYGGKVDSMYNDATRAALRRFQGDQQLAVTGRINEATLHALQLD